MRADDADVRVGEMETEVDCRHLSLWLVVVRFL